MRANNNTLLKRENPVTCVLFSWKNRDGSNGIFGPTFLRECDRDQSALPRTNDEVATVLLFLAIAETAKFRPDDMTAIGHFYHECFCQPRIKEANVRAAIITEEINELGKLLENTLFVGTRKQSKRRRQENDPLPTEVAVHLEIANRGRILADEKKAFSDFQKEARLSLRLFDPKEESQRIAKKPRIEITQKDQRLAKREEADPRKLDMMHCIMKKPRLA